MYNKKIRNTRGRKALERKYFLELLSTREDKIRKLEQLNLNNLDRINELFEENKNMRKNICELQRQSEHLNNIHNDLNRLHMQAKANSEDMIDSAKEEAMDTLRLSDDLNKQIAIFKKDLKLLENDLSIGTDRLKIRISEFYKTIAEFQYKIKK